MRRILLSYLHLSDIHFAGEEYKSENSWSEVVDALTRYLENNSQTMPTPDVIIITGDISYEARTEQYERASCFLNELLKALNLEKKKDRVVLIPGNHDIKRPQGDSETHFVPIPIGSEMITRILEDEAVAKQYYSYLDNYNQWTKEFFGDNRFVFRFDHQYFLRTVTTEMGLRIAVAGFNTALTDFEKQTKSQTSQSSKKKYENKEVFIGEPIIESAFRKLETDEPPDLAISLGHHPLGWFMLDNVHGDNVATRIRNGFDIYLNGHLHTAALKQTIKNHNADNETPGFNPFLEMTAGAVHAHAEHQYPNTVVLTTIYGEPDCLLDKHQSIDMHIKPITYAAGPKKFIDCNPQGIVGFATDGELKENLDRGQRWYSQLERTTIKKLNETPTLHIGDYDTLSQIFASSPNAVVRLDKFLIRPEDCYRDYGEGNRIELRINDGFPSLPEFPQSVTEKLEEYDCTHNTHFADELNSGMAGYGRIVSLPRVFRNSQTDRKEMIIELGDSCFGYHYIRVLTHYLKDLDIPEFASLAKKCTMLSLGVKVALVFKKSEKNFVLLQRRGQKNFVRPGAWDLSAAGYLDPQVHSEDNGKTISLWKAASMELKEELCLRKGQVPYREKYYFLYLFRNTNSGLANVAGIVTSPFQYDVNDLNNRVKEKFSKVSEVAACEINPKSIAEFIIEKHYWSPTAILVLLSTLGFFGFRASDIEREFIENEVYERVTFKQRSSI